MEPQHFGPLHPKTVLAVVAHPDDIEVGMGGTLARYIAAGAAVYYLVLTNGNKGSEDRSLSPDQLRDMRREEQRSAAQILGVREVSFCDYGDGELMCSLGVKRDIVRTIRRVKPDLVFTLDPTVVYAAEIGVINHPDHRAAGQATLDAVFPLARDHLAFPELLSDEQLEPHKVSTVLMMNFERQNFYEDITDHIDKKIEALHAHRSQFGDPEVVGDFLRNQAEKMGSHIGAKYAEGFMRVDLRY